MNLRLPSIQKELDIVTDAGSGAAVVPGRLFTMMLNATYLQFFGHAHNNVGAPVRTCKGLWRLGLVVKACNIAQISKEHLDQAVVEGEATSAPTADGMRATEGLK